MLRTLVLLSALLFGATAASAASVSIVVDISQQSMVVSVDGDVQYQWDVSTGKSGYYTPTGTYGPTRMHREYYSVKYDGAPMPYSIFFYGGYAIHGTTYVNALGSPASHGCVRLLTANAQTLFDLVRQYGAVNTSIRIKA
jgi:lipoprotein-anchoring transpeptidase ErfK/SrfK